jgi:pimeloyl-ACP methyl ester carboxylesterase
LWVLLFSALPVHAATPPTLLKVPLERGVDCPVYWMPHEAERATLVLLPGGPGGLEYDAAANAPLSKDFLIRSRELFHKAGFNIAIVDRPQDRADLNLPYRKSAGHSRDIRTVLLRLKQLTPATLWLVGTSRGTVSAANAAISSPELLAGLVLTASIVNPENKNNVLSLALKNIRVPTLVLHHRRDMCRGCPPDRAKDILTGLTKAPRKELIFISGGSDASGDSCNALHYHGFIGQEAEAVDRITSWISGAHAYTYRYRIQRGSSL